MPARVLGAHRLEASHGCGAACLSWQVGATVGAMVERGTWLCAAHPCVTQCLSCAHSYLSPASSTAQLCLVPLPQVTTSYSSPVMLQLGSVLPPRQHLPEPLPQQWAGGKW